MRGGKWLKSLSPAVIIIIRIGPRASSRCCLLLLLDHLNLTGHLFPAPIAAPAGTAAALTAAPTPRCFAALGLLRPSAAALLIMLLRLLLRFVDFLFCRRRNFGCGGLLNGGGHGWLFGDGRGHFEGLGRALDGLFEKGFGIVRLFRFWHTKKKKKLILRYLTGTKEYLTNGRLSIIFELFGRCWHVIHHFKYVVSL